MALKNRKRVKWLKKLWGKLAYKYKTDKSFRAKVHKYKPYINGDSGVGDSRNHYYWNSLK